VELAIRGKRVSKISTITYPLESGITLVDSNDLSSSFDKMTSLHVINKLGFHASIVSQMSWKIHSFLDGLGVGSVTGFSIGVSKNVFRLYTLYVSSVSYIKIG